MSTDMIKNKNDIRNHFCILLQTGNYFTKISIMKSRIVYDQYTERRLFIYLSRDDPVQFYDCTFVDIF